MCMCDDCIADFLFVFFFKQKTAYEMRISDWSSDVCSSDLRICLGHFDMDAFNDLVLAEALKMNRDPVLRTNIYFDLSYDNSILAGTPDRLQIGRASCRERVCQYV